MGCSLGCYHFKRMTIYRNILHCSGRKEGRGNIVYHMSSLRVCAFELGRTNYAFELDRELS